MKQQKYYCKNCDKTVLRESDKAWIKSWCEKIQKYTRLMKVKDK